MLKVLNEPIKLKRTMVIKSLDLDIEMTAKELTEILSDGYILMMMECFVLTMKKSNMSSSSKLKPYNINTNLLKETVELYWEKVCDKRIELTHKNENQTTDFAAMLVSLSLLQKLDELRKECDVDEISIETSATGSGIDFWIADKAKPLNFKARLEISGIKVQSKTNNLKYRANKKSKQVKKSATTFLPALISLVEFSQFEALVIKK